MCVRTHCHLCVHCIKRRPSEYKFAAPVRGPGLTMATCGAGHFRFIVHNDYNNPHIESLERFSEEIDLFQPALLVVGGLQMMDNFPFKEGESRKSTGNKGCDDDVGDRNRGNQQATSRNISQTSPEKVVDFRTSNKFD